MSLMSSMQFLTDPHCTVLAIKVVAIFACICADQDFFMK